MSEVSICSSGKAFKASISASCAGESLLIVITFVTFGLGSRDDANDFIAIMLFYGVRDQQNQDLIDPTNRLPSLLATHIPILDRELIRIVKDMLRQFKADAVLCQIDSVLLGSHSNRIMAVAQESAGRRLG